MRGPASSLRTRKKSARRCLAVNSSRQGKWLNFKRHYGIFASAIATSENGEEGWKGALYWHSVARRPLLHVRRRCETGDREFLIPPNEQLLVRYLGG